MVREVLNRRAAGTGVVSAWNQCVRPCPSK